jgi:RNA polymerase sigma factor (sigma-70 family)
MTLALQRDADFVDWFDATLPRVFRLARRTTRNDAEAEDVASEAFARAYSKWPAIRGLPYRDGWVLRTAANISIDAARRGARFPWGRLKIAEASAPRGASVEDDVANRRVLTVALSRLPARQREAVTLRYLAGLTLEETATAMRLGAETVRTHVSRGLATMRAALGTDTWEGLDATD